MHGAVRRNKGMEYDILNDDDLKLVFVCIFLEASNQKWCCTFNCYINKSVVARQFFLFTHSFNAR